MKHIRMLALLAGAFVLSFSSARAGTAECAAAIAAHEATVVTSAIACGTPEPGWGIVCPLELALLGYTYYEMIQACSTPQPPPPIPPTTSYIGSNPDSFADDDGTDWADPVSDELGGYSDDLGGWVGSNPDAYTQQGGSDQQY